MGLAGSRRVWAGLDRSAPFGAFARRPGRVLIDAKFDGATMDLGRSKCAGRVWTARGAHVSG